VEEIIGDIVRSAKGCSFRQEMFVPPRDVGILPRAQSEERHVEVSTEVTTDFNNDNEGAGLRGQLNQPVVADAN
jgi:hypothetical protein